MDQRGFELERNGILTKETEHRHLSVWEDKVLIGSSVGLEEWMAAYIKLVVLFLK